MGNQADQPFYSFICHRGVDTKKNIAGLIYWILSSLGLHPFLDVKSLSLGESIPRKIKEAIHGCTIGIVLFSPSFCNSKYCLEELVLLLEMNKAILPIFWNIQRSELAKVLENNILRFSESDMRRYRTAIEDATRTKGIAFQSEEGYIKLLPVSSVFFVQYKQFFGSLNNEEHAHEMTISGDISLMRMLKQVQWRSFRA